MRLTPSQIEKLAAAVTDRLVTRGILSPSAPAHPAGARIAGIILHDLQAEDTLDEEVKGILEAHRREIDAGQVDYNKMFQMIKKKLAQERNIVL